MVECGIPLKDIYKRCNEYSIDLSTIKACLITHAHGDHCKAAYNLYKIGIPLFASIFTLNALGVEGNNMENLKPQTICPGIKAMPFEVEHDIEGAVGFVIKTSTETVIFVNDHKRWNANLSNFKPDYIFIECNYDHKMVYAQVYDLNKQKKTADAQALKEINIKLSQHERNINAHCSLKGTIKGLQKLNLKNTKCIFLMHLSDRYANEYRMKQEVQMITGVKTLVCGKNGGIK